MKLLNLSLLMLCALAASGQTPQPQPAAENPRYVLSSGISFDAVQQSTSNVSTLAVKVAEPAGLPTYQATTLETALVRSPVTGGWQLSNTGTLRLGVCQTAYQRTYVSLGACADAGVMKGSDATLGTVSGSPWLSWDLVGWLTKGKAHVYVIPSIRWIAISGVQVQSSPSIRIGTGF